MFNNANIHYSSPMRGDSLSCGNSANSSFSDGSSTCWDSSTVYTPVSTPRRGSPHSVKCEGSNYPVPSTHSTPERYPNANGLFAMSALTQSMMSVHHDQASQFSMQPRAGAEQDINGFNYGSYLDNSMEQQFQSHQGLSMTTPPLTHDDMYSPSDASSSPSSVENCVVPSQTTFETFGLNSPMHPVRPLQFDIDFECQASDFEMGFPAEYSSPGSLKYLAQDLNHYQSEHSTPSRSPSYRQSLAQDYGTNAGMAHFQLQLQVEPKQKSRSHARLAERRRSKVPNNIHISGRSRFPCDAEGCGKKFARAEHLKRHQKIHGDSEKSPCPFCEKLFQNGRKDNLKTHVELHTKKTKGGRTNYFPEAQAYYDSLSSKPRKSAAAKALVKREGGSTGNSGNGNMQRVPRSRI